ncbi:myosin [Thraustotheca clavata]|uniref:Myosin n=1 Tax=Thraustotheca clavata TaxID=74557 RepID=A0A1V9Z0M9_9STRA|nr:myosin [Thraustotheca clavata]
MTTMRRSVGLTDSPKLESEIASIRSTIESYLAFHVDPAIVSERDLLLQQITTVQKQIAHAQDIRVIDAQVIGCRKSIHEGRSFAEFHVEIVTKDHGTLSVWHTSDKFSALAQILGPRARSCLPDVPKMPVRRLTDAALGDRMNILNEFLQAITKSNDLEWGIRVNDDISVYKRRCSPKPIHITKENKQKQLDVLMALTAERDVHAEYKTLKAQLATYKNGDANKIVSQEAAQLKTQLRDLQATLISTQKIYLISARIVEFRKGLRSGDEYKLEIDTNNRGTLSVWHRYSTFYNLAGLMHTKYGQVAKSLPTLPKQTLFSQMSNDVMTERAKKLNAFLAAAVANDALQWGLRIDENTCAYKYRKRVASRTNSSVDDHYSSVSTSTAASSDDEKSPTSSHRTLFPTKGS